MRDIDQALARAYGRRNTSAPSEPAKTLPTPHFSVDSDRTPRPEPDESIVMPVGLRWPETVRLLEREHGERFEELADALVEVRDQRRVKVLLFTSCHRAEGRTSLVLALARALARRPGRTLLVDADLTGPMLARQLGLRPRYGLDDLVESGMAPGEALIESPDDNLWVLPLRAAVARPREFLAGAGWACTMARLRREFDMVLLDGSPLFAGLSAAVLHNSVDAAILVRNRALTGERAMTRAREVLDAGGIPLLGMAETFV